ncbi:MAG TPA: VOC family protein [Ktedonobacterales bacterium]
MHIRGTHHVALLTKRFAELRAFYVETLGLRVIGGFPGCNIVFLDAGGIAIELIEEEGDGTPGIGRGWDHLALEVDDVDDAYTELVARGVPFASPPEDFPPKAPSMRIAFLKDPDGNLVELVQPLAERFPGAAGP